MHYFILSSSNTRLGRRSSLGFRLTHCVLSCCFLSRLGHQSFIIESQISRQIYQHYSTCSPHLNGIARCSCKRRSILHIFP
ncbi:hypothetical protein PsYK624_095760 [Phanerochaete sordida]|uniref:Uncharacterized protein n=1 Tax=Phanerochaete sordida TaxID=48140 RepID=A0A9P3LGT3_9APHY|nr:hypothetical protein PsYK624_095760 [Phanerochaete sordida]